MSFVQPKVVADGGGPGIARKRLYWEGDIFGNNNYQSTGDNYTASQFGMAGITVFDFHARTNSGTYSVSALPPANSSNANEGYAPAPQNWTLHWYAANGTEVGNNNNLSAEVVRAQVWGL